MATPIKIQTRHDTEQNWINQNPILLEGERGVVLQNTSVGSAPRDVMYEVVGNGVSRFIDLKRLFVFAPIRDTGRVGQGRDLDNPDLRGKSHNIFNPFTWIEEYLYPYAEPTLSVSGPSIPTQEVGDTYSLANAAFAVSINNAQNIYLNTQLSPARQQIRIDGSTIISLPLSESISRVYNHTKTLSLNRTTAGTVDAVIFDVKRSDNQQYVPVPAVSWKAVFKYRTYLFFWDAADDLFAKSDSQIQAILDALNNVTGYSSHVLRDDLNYGNVTVNTVNNTLNPTRKTMRLYLVAPVSFGTAYFASSSFQDSPAGTTTKDISFTNGNATTAYRLNKMGGDLHDGEYKAFIKKA